MLLDLTMYTHETNQFRVDPGNIDQPAAVHLIYNLAQAHYNNYSSPATNKQKQLMPLKTDLFTYKQSTKPELANQI